MGGPIQPSNAQYDSETVPQRCLGAGQLHFERGDALIAARGEPEKEKRHHHEHKPRHKKASAKRQTVEH
eukprot:15432101-Alexandrium_andersonii.AAC.1